MSVLNLNPTEIAHWHQLVLDTQADTGLYLPEAIENYVVLTLSAYTTRTSLASIVIAIEFLESLKDTSNYSMQKLRDVGDHCLILSGLFPDRIKRKNVSEKYLVNIGKEAYYTLSYAPVQWQLDQGLFYQLFENFTDLIQLLKAMRTKK